ncbi:MAG TPA: GNAT family N-acetyltransferase, partial [Nocardioidaceae bacterium]
TGLTDVPIFAVDLSGSWALFGADVDRDTLVDLVDPEHDRFEWLAPADCARRILPPWVADAQVARGAQVPMLDVRFRPMRRDDIGSVLAWQQAPHAERWFHGDRMTLEAAQERYGARIDGDRPVHMWAVSFAGHDAGYLQHYRIGDLDDEYATKTRDPEAVGFDYLIGDPTYIGRGLGTRMIWTFLRDVLLDACPEAPRFLASPDHRNAASLRALAKCGFVAGDWIDMPSASGEGMTTEVVCTLDRRHWFG